jgi:sterol desaturase/sphingolipid hydroxylase (fatty acid hydroxylase superfamily)
MTTLGQWLADGAFHAPLHLVAAATILWFIVIYSLIAGGAYAFAIDRLPRRMETPGGSAQRMRDGQVRQELLLSALSILVFAVQATTLVWMLRKGWLVIAWDRVLWHLLWELPVLYFWNEIHFFLVHRLLHWGPLYRSVHIWHHRSVLTTPFSAYSFHPIESFLLGAVMPLALVFHAFSPWSLLALTVMSLLLNVSGHLPHERIREAWVFALPHSRYHNRHHREFNAHFAFSFPPLDHWFGGGPGASQGAKALR